MITKGFKTSELWVVLLLIASQYAQNIGIDLNTVQGQVAELAKQIQAQAGDGSDGTMWLAVAYVVGRQLLKWRELGVKKDALS